MKLQDTNAANLTFGIEFETVVPRASGINIKSADWGGHGSRTVPVLAGAYNTAGEWLAAPTLADGRGFSATWDSTIRYGNGECGVEFVSPILKGDEGVALLLQFMDFLRAIGTTVNSSCGLHVHVGVASAVGPNAGVEKTCHFIENVTALTAATQSAFFAQTGTDRHQCHWTRPIGDSVKDAVKIGAKRKCLVTMAGSNRYQMLNLANINGRGTVEYRAFAGTINASKVLHHLACCLGVASLAAATDSVNWRDEKVTGLRALRNLHKVLGWTPDAERAKRRQAKGIDVAFGLFGELYTRFDAHAAKAVEMARKWDSQFYTPSTPAAR